MSQPLTHYDVHKHTRGLGYGGHASVVPTVRLYRSPDRQSARIKVFVPGRAMSSAEIQERRSEQEIQLIMIRPNSLQSSAGHQRL